MAAANDEFSLIKRLCEQITGAGSDGLVLGPGDDAALFNVPSGQQLVVTTDTLNAGIHFFTDTDPADIGHKSLAVNLSDLAAMGATPKWVTLNLSLPKSEMDLPAWIDGFASGFAPLAAQHQVALAGGDMTSGPLSVTITAMGCLPNGSAVLRSGAQPGDAVFVTGTLGDAAAALHLFNAGHSVPDNWQQRLLRPSPRLATGQALRGIASSMIDISDGLLADLGHILDASGCAATIECGCLPLSAALRGHPEFDWQWPLAGGDDYELCFTAAPEQMDPIMQIAADTGTPVTRIGEIWSGQGIVCLGPDGKPMTFEQTGWDHFHAN